MFGGRRTLYCCMYCHMQHHGRLPPLRATDPKPNADITRLREVTIAVTAPTTLRCLRGTNFCPHFCEPQPPFSAQRSLRVPTGSEARRAA